MFKMDGKHVAIYFLFGLGFAVVMGFMYMQYVYYDAMLLTLQITNAQLGFLITVEAILALITSIPGGIIADKMDVRKALSFTLMGMMLFVALFAIYPTYKVALFVWGINSCLMSVWYCAVYKAVRVIAPPEAIGKSFGMFGIGVAIGSILVNMAGLALYEAFAVTDIHAGFSAIVWAFFVAGTISALGGYFLSMKMDIQKDTVEEEHGGKATLKEFLETIKDSGTWLYVIGCFCIYSFQISISYFTPYFTAVLGTTVAFSGVVAVFRQYGLRIISAPIGGWLGDRVGGTAKVIRGSMCILGLLVVTVLLIPKTSPLALLVVIVFILGLLGTMNISLQASISADSMVPPKRMGIVVGLTSVFSADLFQETMFGSWLDKYGELGYQYIWIYTICVIVLCVSILTIMIRRRAKKETAAPVTEAITA